MAANGKHEKGRNAAGLLKNRLLDDRRARADHLDEGRGLVDVASMVDNRGNLAGWIIIKMIRAGAPVVK
jgi:hypothetical protein